MVENNTTCFFVTLRTCGTAPNFDCMRKVSVIYRDLINIMCFNIYFTLKQIYKAYQSKEQFYQASGACCSTDNH